VSAARPPGGARPLQGGADAHEVRKAGGAEHPSAIGPVRKVPVEVDKVVLAYGRTPVLRDVSISVAPGEFFALLGPSGSGKSTLLRLIAGFNRAQQGQVRIDGRDVTPVPPWRRNVGMVFQNYALWPHMTVWQNLAFGLEERRLPRSVVARRVDAMLDLIGLRAFGTRRPGELSGGQQQRVALGRTLVIEPQVLLLDEPLSNLDRNLRVQMRHELRALQRTLGITTIFVTHDQEEAMTTADRMAVMDEGVVQQIGTPMELYDAPVNRFVASFVGTANFLEGRIVGRDAATVAFDGAATGRLRIASATALETGASALLAFRPHAVDLAAPDAPPRDRHVQVGGTLVDREFVGEFVRYHVRLAVGTTLVADRPHLANARVFAAGERVTLEIPHAQMRLLA
jgi:iron(III) transport system ATP-binding protein